MSEKKRLKKGEAKVQFIACRERIAELRAFGLDIKSTYRQLVKENRITMTYTGFYENISQRQKKDKRKIAKNALHQTAGKTATPIDKKQDTGWSLDEKLAGMNLVSKSKLGEKIAAQEEVFSKAELI